MTNLIIMSTLKHIGLTFNEVGHFPESISELISHLPMSDLYSSRPLQYPSLEIMAKLGSFYN